MEHINKKTKAQQVGCFHQCSLNSLEKAFALKQVRTIEGLNNWLKGIETEEVSDVEQSIPIYGCYVVGRFWYFVVIEGQEYAISDAYTATRVGDLLVIVKLLKGLKTLLLKQVRTLKL